MQLEERSARFGLSLNSSKTLLIEFGRFAVTNRRKRGLSKPEAFDFLSITHCCSFSRRGDFQVLLLTVKKKRMRETLFAIRKDSNRRRHDLVRIQGNGSNWWWAVTSLTTRCREAWYVLAFFDWRYVVSGGKPSSVTVSVICFNGHVTDALLNSIYRGLEMYILTLRIASRHMPKAGSECLNSARTDLCRGAADKCRSYRDRANCTHDTNIST